MASQSHLRNVFVILLLLVLSATSYAQTQKPFAVLPESASHDVSSFCSREGLQGVNGSWHPTRRDIARLESDLSRIAERKVIGNPRSFYRQYIPVVVGGKKLVYVNAFSTRLSPDWHERVVNICDSGSAEWGTLYDPATGRFSELRTNLALRIPPPPPLPK